LLGLPVASISTDYRQVIHRKAPDKAISRPGNGVDAVERHRPKEKGKGEKEKT
jgi:hypothetical protein